MAKQYTNQDLPNTQRSRYVGESVTASWWGKIFPFSWIGSWWSGKGSAQSKEVVSPVVPETKNEESEEEPTLGGTFLSNNSDEKAAPTPTQTAWYSGVSKFFSNVFSFGRWGSSNDIVN